MEEARLLLASQVRRTVKSEAFEFECSEHYKFTAYGRISFIKKLQRFYAVVLVVSPTHK